MMEIVEIVVVISAFFVLGHVLNAVGETLYWKWVDWRASKENKRLD
jgi:hypothetical protein